jgi:hypothetical protein
MQFDLWGNLHDPDLEVMEIEFLGLSLVAEKEIIIPQGKFILIGEIGYNFKVLKNVTTPGLYLLCADSSLIYLCRNMRKLKEIADACQKADDLYPGDWESDLSNSYLESKIMEIDPTAIATPETYWSQILSGSIY